MKQTLIDRYLAGETTASEERTLQRLLQESPREQLTPDERTILDLLSYTDTEADEEDIFAIDLTEEYDRVAKPQRSIRMWPWVAAACLAGIALVLLTPPRSTEVAKGPDPQPVPDTIRVVKPDPAPQLMAEAVPVTPAPTRHTVATKVETPMPTDTTPETSTQPAPEEHLVAYTVSNPERLEYTPEEIEALKQRARDKYLEWLQLEREIMEYDRQQTAALLEE